ncbi:aminomethyl-transferring glycine dehydrogenase subunit GcvPB, partial [Bacillus paranthracis]|nr:aminomethyl-transferring glycine dehydrogenase subunit GcvPB [Bacillus paranthracis]
PLNVEVCIMIVPTEPESKETFVGFLDKMIQIDKEVEEHPEHVQESPHTRVNKLLKETMSARKPFLRYEKPDTVQV